MNDKADNCKPVFDKLLSKNEQPNPTIQDLVSRQLASSRLRRLHVDSTLRNWHSSLAFYGDVLKQFTPDDLLVDGMFNLFLGHSSTQVTYNAYFHAEHKRTLAREG